MNVCKRAAVVVVCILLGVGAPAEAQVRAEPGADAGTPAATQTAAPPDPAPSDGVKVSIYPVLLWVPAFSATTNVPPFPDLPEGPELPGSSGSTSTSLDGAALAGLSIDGGLWRIDADGIWGALGATRDRPLLDVDLDIVYGHVSGGIRVSKGLYLTGGVRRVALDYDISVEDRQRQFGRKVGIWDPLVGVGWHGPLGSRMTLHLTGEGGGFGVGADVDLAGSIRADLRLAKHVGLTFGYSALYLELSDTVLGRTLEVKQTLHGPVVGFGLYF